MGCRNLNYQLSFRRSLSYHLKLQSISHRLENFADLRSKLSAKKETRHSQMTDQILTNPQVTVTPHQEPQSLCENNSTSTENRVQKVISYL